MSWSEVKKINGDMKKSLDTLIKEQFNTNNSNVSTVKNDLTTVKSDLNYIKNTQLGTNLNNLLTGSTGSTVSFTDKPLVDKINYLLLSSGEISLVSTSTYTLASMTTPVTTTRAGDEKTIFTYDVLLDGQLTITSSLTSMNTFNDLKVFIGNTSKGYMTPSSSKMILNVKRGDTLTFKLNQASGVTSTITCNNIKILGDIAFKNIFQKV